MSRAVQLLLAGILGGLLLVLSPLTFLLITLEVLP